MISDLRSFSIGKAVTQVLCDGAPMGKGVEQRAVPTVMPGPLCFPPPRLDEPDDIRRWFEHSARS
jgi:hypothetical protein